MLRLSYTVFLNCREASAALLILGNGAPGEETAKGKHTALKEEVASEDGVSSDFVLDVHFPLCQCMILNHLLRILKDPHLSHLLQVILPTT